MAKASCNIVMKAQATKNPKNIEEIFTYNGAPHIFGLTFNS
jgi:hypothetical protein